MRVIRTWETNNFRVYDGIESFPIYISGDGISGIEVRDFDA